MNRARLDPQGPYKRDPVAPHQMVDRLTPAREVMVLCHLGVPRLEREEWSLTIDGMVERPRTLRFDDLMQYPKVELTSVHQRCGSPFAPFEPTRRVSNVRWRGVRLADVIADCRPDAAARYLWSFGADSGQFGGVTIEAYAKDLPMGRLSADVLIAHEMNGEPLAPEHGFPARLVVPGFYGTNSVKWLTRIVAAEDRSSGPFTTRWYNDPVLDEAGLETGATTPVWSIAPESLIVSPRPESAIDGAAEQEIWGWAWADGGVGSVAIRTDGEDGGGWQRALLEPSRGREWQRFSLRWKPSRKGVVKLTARAEGIDGSLQAMSGRRNAVLEVPVTVIERELGRTTSPNYRRRGDGY